MCNIHGEVTATMHTRFTTLASTLCAEARAMLEGLRLAHRLDIQNLTVCSDSLNLISMLNKETGEVAEVLFILWDIVDVQKYFQELKFIFTNRCRNSIAHKLARLGVALPLEL